MCMYLGRHDDTETGNGIIVSIEKTSLQSEVARSPTTATEVSTTTINRLYESFMARRGAARRGTGVVDTGERERGGGEREKIMI